MSVLLTGCTAQPPRFFTAEQDAAIRELCAPTGCWIVQKPGAQPAEPPKGPSI